MVRRLLTLAILVAVGLVVYHNRQRFSALAGLGTPKVQIAGDWHPLRHGFKQDTLYTFADELISRDGEVVGQYDFKGFNEVEVTIDQEVSTYTLEFPDDDTMEWYRMVEGKRQLSRSWKR